MGLDGMLRTSAWTRTEIRFRQFCRPQSQIRQANATGAKNCSRPIAVILITAGMRLAYQAFNTEPQLTAFFGEQL